MIMNFDNHKLDLNLGWRIGEEAFLKIVELIHQEFKIPNHIVEFGSGASSIRLALSFPKTNILSIDADANFYNQTQALAQEFLEFPNLLQLKYQALSFQKYGIGKILTYTQEAALSNLNIDCVIIDGPPFYTLRGREACLYQIYDQLRVGGLVILDDVNREGEKTILKNWLSVYPDSFDVEIIAAGHEIAILQKKQSVQAHWLSTDKHQDSMQINQRYDNLCASFLNLENADFGKIIASLPSNLVVPSLENPEYLDDFINMISIIKATYKSIADQINVVAQTFPNLTDEERFLQQIESFCCCLESLGLTAKV